MHISKCLKYFFESLLFIFFAVSLYPAPPEPKELAILKHAYPDVSFTAVYDAALSDFKIDVVQNRGAIRKTATLYAPLSFVRSDCPPILIVSGDRNLELYGRYEETAYFWRL